MVLTASNPASVATATATIVVPRGGFAPTSTQASVTKYYYFGSQRVAMRQGDVVYYLHGDHLGSTSLTTDASGGSVAQARYLPCGQERWTWGAAQTDFTFTGQRNERGFGLSDYNARYYDPYLNRWISPDSIVPQPGDPQNLNRFSYVLDNPVKHQDPTGHYQCEDAECKMRVSPATGEFLDKNDERKKLSEYYGKNHRRSLGSTDSLAEFQQDEPITTDEFNDLLETVYDGNFKDRMLAPPSVSDPGFLGEYVPGAMAGRDRFDTPFWNGSGPDVSVCIEGHGCYNRSHVNYVAQGMWGAASGETLEQTLGVVEFWNQEGGKFQNPDAYGHSASEGELYWTRVGYNWVKKKENKVIEQPPPVPLFLQIMAAQPIAN